jgi:hypothetical protein
MKTDDVSLQFDKSTLGKHRHICAFFNSTDEQHRVLRSFVTDGFDRGDKAFHYVDPARWDEHLAWLADEGIDVPEATGIGQLDVRRWQDAPLRGGGFHLEPWLASFEEILRSGQAGGYEQIRVMGHMEWALTELPGVEGLMEYETRVNQIISRYEDTVVCTYDLTKFGADIVIHALRTHPLVIIGGLLQENPFFVPPERLLLEMRERRMDRISPAFD